LPILNKKIKKFHSLKTIFTSVEKYSIQRKKEINPREKKIKKEEKMRIFGLDCVVEVDSFPLLK